MKDISTHVINILDEYQYNPTAENVALYFDENNFNALTENEINIVKSFFKAQKCLSIIDFDITYGNMISNLKEVATDVDKIKQVARFYDNFVANMKTLFIDKESLKS